MHPNVPYFSGARRSAREPFSTFGSRRSARELRLNKAQMEVYGPEFTKETKSEATWVFTSDLNTSTERLSHSTVGGSPSSLEMC